MPGPGRKKEKKAFTKKALVSPYGVPGEILDDIDSVGWNLVIKILSQHFDLPDLTTRSGLKKVHSNFNTVYKRLDSAYQRNQGNEKIIGGIVGIYTQMCVDSILRNRLCDEGLLSKIIHLLGMVSCRHMALRALATLTHHAGSSVRFEIANHCSTLLALMKNNPDDDTIAEFSVTIFSHSLRAAVERPGSLQFKSLNSLDLDSMITACLVAVKSPGSSAYLIGHASELFAILVQHFAEACKTLPSIIKFLIAGLRSKDWAFRGGCLATLMKFHERGAELDRVQFDHMKFIAAIQDGFPDELQDIMMDYGLMQTEAYLTLETSGDFQKAMMTVARSRDLYSLGIQLAEFTTRTEFSISDGAFQVEDHLTGKTRNASIGLPFTRWSDALPHSAKAIRRGGKQSEADAADILDIKYYIMRQQIPDAVRVAKAGLKRNPDCAYFHYAITLSANNIEGLRAAKKALKCKQTTSFIRFQTMQRAVEHAGHIGIRLLLEASPHDTKKLEEGVAFLTSALEDSKMYLEQVPPDNRHKKNVLYWNALLTVTMKDVDVEYFLQKAKDKLRIADDFGRCFGITPPKTTMRLTTECVMREYVSALIEFSASIEKTSTESLPCIAESPEIDQDLPERLEKISFEGDEVASVKHCSHPKVNASRIALYRCSWCGNPSAALRKCGGCSVTRYCDQECQKAHWKDHKKMCQPVLPDNV